MTDLPAWLPIAWAELGVTETAGAKSTARVLEYHKATGLSAADDETAWCGSFVAWVMQKAGVAYGRNNAARARSWETWGHAIDKPQIGCIAVLWRGSKTAATGHVGIVVGWDNGGNVYLLGGNQGNAVSVQRFNIAERVLSFRMA